MCTLKYKRDVISSESLFKKMLISDNFRNFFWSKKSASQFLNISF